MKTKQMLPVLIAILWSVTTTAALASSPTTPPPATTLSLSLIEAINLALRNNPNVKSAQLQRVTDKFSLQVAHNEFEWRYRLNGQALWSRNAHEDTTHRSHSARLTPEARIKSPLGLEFSAGLPQITHDGSHYNAELTVTAKQPLLRGAGSNVNLANLRNSLNQEQINQLNLKNALMNTVITVIRDYRNVQQAQLALTIQDNNLHEAKQNLTRTQAKIDAGKLPPRDIVEINRQIASQSLQLEIARNTLAQQLLILLRDVWLDPASYITLPDDIDSELTSPPAFEPSFDTALAHNIQYQSALATLKQSERAVILAKDNQRWQLDLSATHTTGGGNHRSGFNGLLSGHHDASNLRLDLDIPINDKPRQQGLVNANINLKQAHLRVELLRRELRDAVKTAIQDLTSQQKQVQLAKNATELARESLSLEQQKLLFGKATQLDVTGARRTLINAENDLVRNKIRYLNTLTEFRRLLGITLEHWQVDVDS